MDLAETIKAVIAYVGQDARCVGITGVVRAEAVKGQRQESDCDLFDHEYVDQHAYWEDDFYGTMFFPLPTGEYMAVEYASH